MIVIGLETVTRAGSLAICRDAQCDGQAGDDTRTHGERLPGELMSWLATHQVSLPAVDLFAIVSGPGSFTGLRVGMAAIQGLALAAGRKVVAVPTLEAIAEGWASQQPDDGRATLLVPCLDGQRGEVFAAGYLIARGAPFEAASLVLDARAGLPEQLSGALQSLAGTHAVVCVGSGALRYRARLEQDLPGVRVEALTVPLAQVAALRAQRRPDLAVQPHALKPVYVRRPDAVLARERAAVPSPARPLDDLRFRRASSSDDLAAVEGLQARTFSNPWGTDAIRWELENTDVARLFLAYLPDGDLVAYCACWTVFDELHVNSLAVAETWRRRGIGRRLMAHVVREAVAEGARSATLEVRRSNQAALGLYESIGFQVEAVRKDYYQSPREDALILWHRQLAGPGPGPAR